MGMNDKSKASLSEWWSQPATRLLEMLEIDQDDGLSSDRADDAGALRGQRDA